MWINGTRSWINRTSVVYSSSNPSVKLVATKRSSFLTGCALSGQPSLVREELPAKKDLISGPIIINEIPVKHKIIVSMDASPRKLNDIEVLPWKEFLTRLWTGTYSATWGL